MYEGLKGFENSFKIEDIYFAKWVLNFFHHKNLNILI